MFGVYLKLGFDHILDINAYDHILFVLALCAVYVVSDWKKVLVLVTAFTIGHSATLALSVYKLVHINPSLIEKLIPITIILTAVYNIANYKHEQGKKSGIVLYLMACFFGLIHGLGFSNYLNALLGSEEDILIPLLGFNLGVEGGQIIVVAMAMALSFILVNLLKVKHFYWTIAISTIAAGVASYLFYQLF
jgi:hypothetical protein